MNSTEDYGSVEELDEYFSKKVALLNECLVLKNMDPESRSILNKSVNSVVEVRAILKQIKKEVKEGQDQLTEMKDLLYKMELLNDSLDHMQKNFPAVLKSQPAVPAKRETVTVAATPVVPKKTKQPDNIKCLTIAEFESVPKYMKGRLQYTQVNNFIDNFNKAIVAKYKFLSLPSSKLKPSDFKTRNIMKSEENDETKGLYFCTRENMKELANIPADKNTDTFLTILRHCKRLKEVRGPGSLKRYVVIS